MLPFVLFDHDVRCLPIVRHQHRKKIEEKLCRCRKAVKECFMWVLSAVPNKSNFLSRVWTVLSDHKFYTKNPTYNTLCCKEIN